MAVPRPAPVIATCTPRPSCARCAPVPCAPRAAGHGMQPRGRRRGGTVQGVPEFIAAATRSTWRCGRHRRAFTAVVTAVVEGLITPLVGMIGGPTSARMTFTINDSTFSYGIVINAVIYFLLGRRSSSSSSSSPSTSCRSGAGGRRAGGRGDAVRQAVLLAEIRDLRGPGGRDRRVPPALAADLRRMRHSGRAAAAPRRRQSPSPSSWSCWAR